MVKLVENSKWSRSRHDDAHFVRENTDSNRLTRLLVPQSYKRARFYHAELGRFISRDPLGYVDGMSLYRGYFVPGDTDPEGLMVTKAGCEAAKKRALVKYAPMINRLKAKGCPVPVIECAGKPSDCKNGEGGYFDPGTKNIKICYSRFRRTSTLELAIRHELVHALDDCSGLDWSDCRHRACSEIRAHSFSNCDKGSPYRRGLTREECIKKFAIESTNADPDCKPSDKLIDELYDECVICKTCAGNPLPPDCHLAPPPVPQKPRLPVYGWWNPIPGLDFPLPFSPFYF